MHAQDNDGDGVPDVTDIDDDNDGILDINEPTCPQQLTYDFYDGVPPGNTVDNIPTTGALLRSTTNNFDVANLQNFVDPGDTDAYAIRYTGFITIDVADTYTFYTGSNDGSKLFINGIEVVDNDGIHAFVEQSGNIFLAAGIHAITILYFEDTGTGEMLTVSYESGSIAKTALPFSILFPDTGCELDTDGVPNSFDLDTDGDGIPDNVEAQPTLSYIPPSGIDFDGNGLDDAYESVPGAGEGITPVDTDGDGIRDFFDSDSNDDGILDRDDNGITLTGTDSDFDGLDDAVDTTDTPLPGPSPDYSDVNGIFNNPATDLPNIRESLTPEVDYREIELDSDGDTIPDSTDIDDDNDGILDVDEAFCPGELSYEFYDGTPTGNTVDNIPTTGALGTGLVSDFDVDAIQAAVDPGDTDNYSIRYTGLITIAAADTYTFYTESDDGSKLFVNGTEVVDNDGNHALTEQSGSIFLAAGIYSFTVLYFENTGDDTLNVSYESGTIAKTALPFSILSSPNDCDLDGDGIPNSLDLDADNDGIPDNVEGQPTLTYVAPSGVDADGNGLDDAYESAPGAGEGISVEDTDADGVSDFIDLDSDNDGNSDQVESGITLTGTDSDLDGLDDTVDTTDTPLAGPSPDYSDPNGIIDDPITDLWNFQNSSNPERDYREALGDNDADSIDDITDIDDDNDGILDVDEVSCQGSLSYEYYDASPTGNTVDNIPTTGALSTGQVTNFDVDALQAVVDPADANNFSIRYTGVIEITVADTYTFYTSSDDGSKLFIDGVEIVDNDGAHGVQERNGSLFMAVGSYQITVLYFENTGGESLAVSYESGTIAKTALPFTILSPDSVCDNDGDGIIDAFDLDADGDGIPDNVEGQPTLTYVTPSGVDADGNGLDDAYESVPGAGEGITLEDTDADGIPDFLDNDSDNDRISDQDESGITLTGLDSDSDGLDDDVDTTDVLIPGNRPNYTDANGVIDTPAISLPNDQNSLTPEVDYRDFEFDTDADGVLNQFDVDDDNDGILDTVENILCAAQLNYEFYDGLPAGATVDNIPTTGALATGVITDFDVNALQAAVDPGDADGYSIRYTGFIEISADDTYTFYTASDDGSKLFINGTEIVDNDGNHGVVEQNGSIFLAIGTHEITVLFFENGGGASLAVSYESGTIAKTAIPFGVLAIGCDEDGDGISNQMDWDSDGDGCNDVNEGYDSLTADPDFDGQYGSTTGPTAVNPDGSVIAAPYTTPVDNDTNTIYDFLEAGAIGLPTISAQPADVTICTSCGGNFSVTTTGDSFQWQFFDGTTWQDLANTAPYSGVTTATLTINSPSIALNGTQYRAIVYNAGSVCVVDSDPAVLTVIQGRVITNRGITFRVNPN